MLENQNSTERTARHRRRLLVECLRPHRLPIACGFFLTAAAAIATTAQPMVIGSVLVKLQAGGEVEREAALLGGLLVVTALLSSASAYILGLVNHRIVRDVRTAMCRSAAHADYLEAIELGSGQLSARLASDATLVGSGVTQGFVQGSLALVTIAAFIAMMVHLSWQLSLVTFGTLGATASLVAVLMRPLQRSVTAVQEAVGHLTATAAAFHEGAAEIRSGEAEAMATSIMAAHCRNAYAAAKRGVLATSALSLLSGASVQLLLLAIVIAAVVLVHDGSLALPDVVAFLFYAVLLGAPISTLMESSRVITASVAASGRMVEVLDLRGTFEAGDPMQSTAEKPLQHPFQALPVRVEGVTFAYPGNPEDTLKGLDMTVAAGGMVALVGPSGSGKSTVLSLLGGLIPPKAGRIRVGATEYSRGNISDMRKWVSLAPQDLWMMPGSVWENVTLGSRLPLREVQMRELLQHMQLSECVSKFPTGVNAMLGDLKSPLSGGERQRVVLARAMAREAPVTLLDETTANLDAITEAAVMVSLKRRSMASTVIIATHRFSVVKECDYAFVINGGRVVSSGPPSELFENESQFIQAMKK